MQKKLNPDDAYMLASVGVNFHITLVVEGVKGFQELIPKEIFKEK